MVVASLRGGADDDADACRAKGERAPLLPLLTRNADNAAEATSRATRTFSAPSIAKLLRIAVSARRRALARQLRRRHRKAAMANRMNKAPPPDAQ